MGHCGTMRHHSILLTLLLLLACIISQPGCLARKNDSSSESESHCPQGCQCSRSDVECTNIPKAEPDMFLTIKPEVYPDLDTIILTGSPIGDISGQNLFGENSVHEHVSLFILSNNSISAFDEHTFQGLPGLEFFYLGNNTIKRVGEDPFRQSPNLKLLDLSNAFAKSSSVSTKQKMLRSMFFDTENRFHFLKELILRDNALTKIAPDAFCKVEGLLSLHLARNDLKEFVLKEGCLDGLQMLDLSGNKITSLSAQMWDNLPNLKGVDISENPLHCDCEIEPLVEKIRKGSAKPINVRKTVCASPPSVKEMNLFDIKEFVCDPPPQNNYIIPIIVLIAAVMIGAIYFCF